MQRAGHHEFHLKYVPYHPKRKKPRGKYHEHRKYVKIRYFSVTWTAPTRNAIFSHIYLISFFLFFHSSKLPQYLPGIHNF